MITTLNWFATGFQAVEPCDTTGEEGTRLLPHNHVSHLHPGVEERTLAYVGMLKSNLMVW